eukprot:46113-Prorocentrum_lima.AAC.1
MDDLRAFDRHDLSAWENFSPFMERLFGAEWQSCNGLNMLKMNDWGGRWRCQMCDKDPEGMDQLISH